MKWTEEALAKHRAKPAVRRGAVYCAPWCGAGCLWDDYLRATERAKALASFLGNGWKPEVWENMGWHYCVKKGEIALHGHDSGKKDEEPAYTLFINTPGAPQICISGRDHDQHPRWIVSAGAAELARLAKLWKKSYDALQLKD